MRQLYQTASSFHFLYVNKNCIKLIFSHFNGAIHFSQIKTGHYIKRTKEEGLFTTSRLREFQKLLNQQLSEHLENLLWKFQSHFCKRFGIQHCHLVIFEKWLSCWALNHWSTSSHPEVFLERCSENMHQMYSRTSMPKCDFNKVAKQLYWNDISTWMLSCKFAAYFQKTASWEHFWMAASVDLS